MRDIPESLLNKLKEKLQTRGAAADPKITLLFRRSNLYINQGGILNPKIIKEPEGEETLGAYDTAFRREPHLYKTYPDYIYRVHVVDGQAYVSRAEHDAVVDAPSHLDYDWEDLYTVGGTDTVDVAIEFNGHWVRTADDAEVCFDTLSAWTHVTESEPWVFWATSGGQLNAQKGEGDPVELVASGVTKLSAIRSWKNVYRWNHDHGLIIAYIKSNAVYYQTFANRGDDDNPLPAAWESERQVTELPTPAQDVAVCRTNDYRTCFLCESNGEIHWAVTNRNWAGMALRDHWITARATDLLVSVTAIDYRDGLHEHTITATGVLPEFNYYDPIALLWALADNEFMHVENDGNFTLYATLKHFLRDINVEEFIVTDTGTAVIGVTDIQTGATPFDLIITTEHMGFTLPGDLTLKFLGSGTTKGEATQNVDPFELTFTPTGIDYQEIPPPEVEVIWNE